jgi:hypothetical protein
MNNSQDVLKVVEFKDTKHNHDFKYKHFYKDSIIFSNEIMSIKDLEEDYKQTNDTIIKIEEQRNCKNDLKYIKTELYTEYAIEFNKGKREYGKVISNNKQRQAFKQIHKAIIDNTFLKVDHDTFSLMTIDNKLLHYSDIEEHKEYGDNCWKVGDIIRLYDYHPNYDHTTFYRIAKKTAKMFLCEELKTHKIIQCIYERQSQRLIIDTIYKIDFNTCTGIEKRFKNTGPQYINYKIDEPHAILRSHKEIFI